jgi:hypothetical protein
MGSIQSIPSIPAAATASATAQKPPPPQAPPAASGTTVSQTTLSQLLLEPTYELTQQAQEGNAQAADLLAQQQASARLLSASGTGSGLSFDLLA